MVTSLLSLKSTLLLRADKWNPRNIWLYIQTYLIFTKHFLTFHFRKLNGVQWCCLVVGGQVEQLGYLTKTEQFFCQNGLLVVKRIHQMFSPICFTNFFNKIFSVWAVEKENNLLIGPKQVFFLSLPVEKEIMINIR